MAELLDLGAKYRRYLRQDEFGPTRAQRMAALRQLLKQITGVSSKLNGLPEHLRSQLGSHLSLDARSGRLCARSSGLYAEEDETVMELLYEAAIDVGRELVGMKAGHDAKPMEALAEAANMTLSWLGALDTTTSWEAVIASDFVLPDAGCADSFSLVRSRIVALTRRFTAALDRLRRRRGPEPGLSVRWLVWQLCDLWRRETEQFVTSSAVRAGIYTSEPQSPAGRFVLAAAEALQPSKSWIREHEHRGAPVRARIISGPKHHLYRAIHLAMREYVAGHP